jgi:prefoldin beta subunit
MQELDLMSETDNVYKLVGPVLMKVDVEEARHNVTKRMEFIEKDMRRLDDTIAARQGEQSALGEEIQKLQQEMQADAATAAREVVAKAMRDDA